MKHAFREKGEWAVKTVTGLGFLLLAAAGTVRASNDQTDVDSDGAWQPISTTAGLLAPTVEPELKSAELDLLSAKIATATDKRRSSSVALDGASLAPVPEPSTVLFGSALLIACGASLRAVRRKS